MTYEYYYEQGVEAYQDGIPEYSHGLVDIDDIDAWTDGWYDISEQHIS